MNMQEIRTRANDMGIQNVSKMRKGELVRSIQQAEGNNACFGAEWRFDCNQVDCCWRFDCQKKQTH